MPDDARGDSDVERRLLAVLDVMSGLTGRIAKALIENTKENLEAAGQQWTDEMEGIVQKLVPNRWANIQTILERAAVEAEQERVAVAAGQ